ncbi:hypothetical protein Tco_0305501 [Tanacetum coccineum]
MFSVCLCARFQEDPKTSHLEAVKHIFRYIKGTTHLGLWYPKGSGIETIVYADSDHAGDYIDRKSTSGVCMFMGCCLTSWFSKKQTALAISTTEAEYVSAGKACQQALWMKQALIDYGVRLDDIPIMCDNKGAIDLTEGDLKKFSKIGAWHAIEDCAQYDKKMLQIPRFIAWLDYDEHVDSLSTMDNEEGVTSPESTTQTLPSFEEYTPPVTYPKEVEKTLGTPIEKIPSIDEPEPQPQPLPNCLSLDVSLGEERGPEPPIKPHSPDSCRMKEADRLTINTPPSPHVASFYLKDAYF